MKKLVLLSLLLPALTTPVLAQDDAPERLPFNQVNCKTLEALEGSEFDTERVTIIVSVPFNITNSDRRLKFYRSMIAFGDRKAHQLVQPSITQADVNDKSGRFGNLRERQSDDDIPTGFKSGGVEYELQTITGYQMTERTGEKSFKIDQDAPIRVMLEAITDSNERESPVWVGECVMTGLFASQ